MIDHTIIKSSIKPHQSIQDYVNLTSLIRGSFHKQVNTHNYVSWLLNRLRKWSIQKVVRHRQTDYNLFPKITLSTYETFGKQIWFNKPMSLETQSQIS